jgi:RNA-splicing ligase RtcB
MMTSSFQNLTVVDVKDFLEDRKVSHTEFDAQVGTIGGGNHFAELQIIEEVISRQYSDLNFK